MMMGGSDQIDDGMMKIVMVDRIFRAINHKHHTITIMQSMTWIYSWFTIKATSMGL